MNRLRIRLPASEHQRFAPRVTQRLIGTDTEVVYGEKRVPAKIVDARVEDEGKMLVMEVEV